MIMVLLESENRVLICKHSCTVEWEIWFTYYCISRKPQFQFFLYLMDKVLTDIKYESLAAVT